MKLFLSSIIIACFLFASQANAINLGFDKTGQAANTAGYGATTETTFAETIGIVIKAALSFVGVIFLVLTVYAGILWLTAHGEEEPVKKAQKIIMTSVIGLVIVASAYGLTNLIVPKILERTTGAGGGAPTAGGAKVECCELPCDTWAFDCLPNQPLSTVDCEAIKGKPLGLKPAEQCK